MRVYSHASECICMDWCALVAFLLKHETVVQMAYSFILYLHSSLFICIYVLKYIHNKIASRAHICKYIYISIYISVYIYIFVDIYLPFQNPFAHQHPHLRAFPPPWLRLHGMCISSSTMPCNDKSVCQGDQTNRSDMDMEGLDHKDAVGWWLSITHWIHVWHIDLHIP